MARTIAADLSDQLDMIRIVPPGRDTSEPAERARFHAWLEDDPTAGDVAHTERVGFGVPGIEILRAADQIDADLIVLGRRPRSPVQRLALGETADAVVRRSARPVLFVSGHSTGLERILVAVDGSDRSIGVLEHACRLARRLDAAVEVVTVEPQLDDDRSALGELLPRTRSVRLATTLTRLAGSAKPPPLVIRRGNPVDEILKQCVDGQADVLVIGYRRGGPPMIFGPNEVARNLLYAAPCSVYTVPL